MEEHVYALTETDRRLGNVLRIGTVAQVDPTTGQVQVDLGDVVTDWLPWTTTRAGLDQVWTTPDVGEQVVLASPGDPSQGVVIGSLFQNAHPQNGNLGKDRRITFKDGSLVEFDRDGSVLNVQVNAAGSIRLNIGSTTLLLQDGQATLTTPALLVDSPSSTFTGNVLVEGALTYQGGMAGSGGSAAATISGPVNITGNVTTTGALTNNGKNVGSTHTHPDPQGGTTGTPT